MGSDLKISTKIQEYILNNGLDLHSVQKEIISYNESLGDIKRMQISISQSQFLHLIVKTSNVRKILEIGTFTGLSALSMSLALPEDGRIIALDKNQETNEIAIKFFEKAKQGHKIKAIILPSSGKARDIDKVLKPVKVPISSIFLTLDVFTIKCKN
jgi:caffeoyl-CoA O-methyltransferase